MLRKGFLVLLISATVILTLLPLISVGCAGSVNPGGQGGSINSPEEAARCWLKSMEWIDGDPGKGRDFDLFMQVADPRLFEDNNGVPIPEEELNRLREMWNARDWEIQFFDIQLETGSSGEDSATIRIVGGKARYIGAIFGTSEYTVQDFSREPGEITLLKIDGRWRVIEARTISMQNP
jgi:hypothetical protein